MQILALSAASGSLYLFQDYGRPDNPKADDEGAALAARLFRLNKLLQQASDVDDGNQQVTTTAAWQRTASPQRGRIGAETGLSIGGRNRDEPTILGAGTRRSNRATPASAPAPSRLAVRQWHLDSVQWHLAEDGDADVLVALAVPADWPPESASHLVTALRDAFILANRPQLLGLSAAAAPAGDVAPPPTAARQLPGSVTPLLTLQALKLLCRLAQEAQDCLTAEGLAPCWLFVAHVDSFMGARPEPPSRGAGGSEAGAADAAPEAGRDGGGSGKGGRKGKGLMQSVLRALRGGEKGSKKGGGKSGGGEQTAAGEEGRRRDGAAAGGPSGEQDPGLRRGRDASEPGPVGQLQHLVLPSDRLPGRPTWDPTSVAAAVLQVRPPPGTERRRSSILGGGAASGAGGDGRQGTSTSGGGGGADALSFPELEDVELAMEVQLGGTDRPPQCFTVVGVRMRHVVAVMAQLAPEEADAGGYPGSRPQRPRAGSISLVRALLRPSLVPLSTLFDYLARWATQDEVAAHGLMLRLLE